MRLTSARHALEAFHFRAPTCDTGCPNGGIDQITLRIKRQILFNIVDLLGLRSGTR